MNPLGVTRISAGEEPELGDGESDQAQRGTATGTQRALVKERMVCSGH
jgi:hypothetical protein